MPIYLMTPLKAFLATEGERNGVHPRTVAEWVRSRCYGWLVIDRRSSRTVLISGTTMRFTKKPNSTRGKTLERPPSNAIRFKEWLDTEAVKLGIKRHSLYMRIKRGNHPGPTLFFGGRQRADYVIPS